MNTISRAADAILKDIRGRRLLKWLFAETADSDPHPIGYVEGPIDLATQRECAETWARLVLNATLSPSSEGAGVLVELVERATQNTPRYYVNWHADAQAALAAHRAKPGAGVARVYIAARFSRRHECNQLAHVLQARGCVITSRWVKPGDASVLPTGISAQAADSERQRFASEDVSDVHDANWTISLMEEPRSNTRGGRHIEFGYALARGQRLTIIGSRETVFHHLPYVEQFDTVGEFIASLPASVAAAPSPATPAPDGEDVA